MQDLLIKNGNVLLFKDDNILIQNKDILVKDGKIAKIEDEISENLNQNIKVIDAKDHIVMPGLINTHAHIPMSIFRETTEGCKLYEWLNERIWPIEDRLTKEDIYYASLLSFIEMFSTGTTCINDQYFMSEQIRDAARKCKVRAVITRTIMDTDGNYKTRVEEFKNFYNTRDENEDLITYSVAPHSLYTCSGACLQATADLARKYNLPIHVHFLESIDELEDIKKKHGKTAIEVLKKYFDGIHTILAHGVHLRQTDIEVLKTMDCGIAHNPVSNMRLGCTIADTTKYLKTGINVGLRN